MSILRSVIRWLHGRPMRTQVDKEYSEGLAAEAVIASKKLSKRVEILKALTERLREEGGEKCSAG